MRTARLWLIAIGVGATISSARAQDTRRPATMSAIADAAVDKLKGLYFATDYAAGIAAADSLVKRLPNSRELAAWRIANMARGDLGPEAIAAADAMLKANRTDPWGWFAKTVALEFGGQGDEGPEILAASLEAYKRASRDPDVVWVRALALNGNRQPMAALSLLDTVSKRQSLTPALQMVQAGALDASATVAGKTNAARRDSALALYARIREANPENASAFVQSASRLLGAGRPTEAYDLVKRAVALSPGSLTAHQLLWSAISARKDRSQSERDAEMLADVESLLALRGHVPPVLLATTHQFETLRLPDRQRAIEDRLLAEFPTSLSAEWVVVNRYRALDKLRRDSTKTDSAVTTRYRQALWDYLNRPTHKRSRLVGDAYRSLFYLTDSTTNPDTLLRIVKGMVDFEGINPHVAFAEGAIRLAERGVHFREAEQIAKTGLDEGKKKIMSQRQIYETVGDYAEALDWMAAIMRDALGWVYYREGKLTEAETELRRAHDLDHRNNRALFHLGQLAERRGQPDSAEAYYTKGALVQAMGTNPNRAALERLYKTRHGSLDGYDAYLANLANADRERRKQEIAQTRIASPSPLKPFALKSLSGALVTLDSLKGKVAVINNWGMWCGPCVAEMPEFQKLSQQYAGDSAVRILTIDYNDPNVDALREWMAKKGFTYTTLLDDGYLSRVGIHTYPTTWFLDREGRIVFQKIGWSEKLVEEFGWRIEAIRK